MKLLRLTFAIQVLFLLACMSARTRVNSWAFSFLELIWFPLAIIWIACLIQSFLPAHRAKWKWHIAVLSFGPVGFFLVQPTAELIKPLLFGRDFPKLEALLAKIESRSLRGKDVQGVEVIEPIGTSDSPVFKIWVERNSSRPIIVTFFVSTAKRIDSAYVFCPQKADLLKVKADWLRIYDRAPNWYEVEGAWWNHDRFKAKQKAAREQVHSVSQQ